MTASEFMTECAAAAAKGAAALNAEQAAATDAYRAALRAREAVLADQQALASKSATVRARRAATAREWQKLKPVVCRAYLDALDKKGPDKLVSDYLHQRVRLTEQAAVLTEVSEFLSGEFLVFGIRLLEANICLETQTRDYIRACGHVELAEVHAATITLLASDPGAEIDMGNRSKAVGFAAEINARDVRVAQLKKELKQAEADAQAHAARAEQEIL
jgi:hypothetical protein